MLKIGDSVQLIFTNEIGTVTHYIDGESVVVNVDGTEIPVFIEHLKKRTPPPSAKKYPPLTTRARKKKSTKPTPKPQHDGKVDNGLQVLLQPVYTSDSGIIDYFLIHLCNDSGWQLRFDYSLWVRQNKMFQLTQTLGKRNTIILNSLAYDDLNENPQLQFTFFVETPHHTKAVTGKAVVKPKAKMLRKMPNYYASINADAYQHVVLKNLKNITQAPPKKVPLQRDWLQEKLSKLDFTEKEIPVPSPKRTINIHANERVIDLHIEKLLPNYKRLHKSLILKTQLQHFESQLEEAIEQQEPKMIAIHGLGKGKLRSEIFKILRCYPQVKHFKNEYDHRFGFGATEIIFEYVKA